MDISADIDEETPPPSPEEQRSKEGNEHLHPDEDLSHGDEGVDDPDIAANG